MYNALSSSTKICQYSGQKNVNFCTAKYEKNNHFISKWHNYINNINVNRGQKLVSLYYRKYVKAMLKVIVTKVGMFDPI